MDFGITVSSNFDCKEQINSELNQVNRVLGILKRTFVSRETDLWKELFTYMIRPHLKYPVQVWNARLIGDIATLEEVQRKATKIPKN